MVRRRVVRMEPGIGENRNSSGVLEFEGLPLLQHVGKCQLGNDQAQDLGGVSEIEILCSEK